MAIVVVGAVFVDIKGFPDHVYLPKGRNVGRVEVVHGGVGRNVAKDIANLELRPRFVSMVDDSAEGASVEKNLRDHKVDTQYLLSVPDGMGMWLAIFDETGDVVGAISKRPVMAPLAKLLEEKGDEIFAGADSIIIEIDIDKDVLKQVFFYAEKYDIPVYAVVANMSIASKRRDLILKTSCFVCNEQEAGILFVRKFEGMSPEELCNELSELVTKADIPAMVVTMGSQGSVYATRDGRRGCCPAHHVSVRDTTGAGDAFCAGVSVGLTYGKSMDEALEIGTRLAASVVTVSENVCPRFQPAEFGIELD